MVAAARIELALQKVFDFIGNKYTLPQGEFITGIFEVESYRNPFYNQTPDKIVFGFGTKKELNIFLKDRKDKYPLVWLVYPVKKSFKNDASKLETYKGLKLIFAINNNVDVSVGMRTQTTKVILESIVGEFLKLMRNSAFKRFVWLDKTKECDQEFYPNYSTDKQATSASTEIWDAITLECTLYLLPDCIK